NLKACLFCGMTTIAFAAGLSTFALESRQTPAPSEPQAGRGAARGQRGAPVNSPEVSGDRHVTFRLAAAQAQAVRVAASDLPALGAWRRMHIYTPPGYQTNNEKYPVFYLLHGAGDSDDSWTSVGRANFILDNLIAAKKAKPMVVVMPAGHTSRTQGLGGGGGFL